MPGGAIVTPHLSEASNRTMKPAVGAFAWWTLFRMWRLIFGSRGGWAQSGFSFDVRVAADSHGSARTTLDRKPRTFRPVEDTKIIGGLLVDLEVKHTECRSGKHGWIRTVQVLDGVKVVAVTWGLFGDVVTWQAA
jgi:hypothetical protein